LSYLRNEIDYLKALIDKNPNGKSVPTHEFKINKYTDLIKEVSKEKHKYTVVVEDTIDDTQSFRLVPVKFPLDFIQKLFGDAKLILLSGTLFNLDVKELAGAESYLEYECNSPIPINRRKILLNLLDEESFNYPIDYYAVSSHLKSILNTFKEFRPCLIHTTYNDAKQLKTFIPELIIHSQDNKKQVLAKWLEEGGILAGAGMSTGLDLKYDLCRLNIILKGVFPSMADMATLKRLYIDETGREWLENEALRHVIQAVGRASRSSSDFSINIICDLRLLNLIEVNKKRVPNYFLEALCYESVSKELEDIKEDIKNGL